MKKQDAQFKLDLEVYKLAVENASDQIVITDTKGLLLYANKALDRITGYDRKKVIGKSPGKMWGGKMPRAFYEKMWKVISVQKKDFAGVVQNTRKNGDNYFAEIKIAPVLDSRKRVKFFVGIERDITKEKIIDQAKNDFIRIASHQLRTPITAISWIVDSLARNLKKQNISDMDRQYLADLSISTKRTLDLIEDLLNLSHVQSEETVPLKPISPLAAVREIIERLHNTPPHTTRVIALHADAPANAKVLSDGHTLKNMVQIFLSNALDYSTAGSTVDVTTHIDTRYTISVTNQGPAIPLAEQENLFKMFFRGEPARRVRPEGTGVGLYIAKTMIEKIKGKLSFTSENGTTTFSISLPLIKKLK